MMHGMIGPLEQWQHELHKVSRSALMWKVEMQLDTSILTSEQRLARVTELRKLGAVFDKVARLTRYTIDPDKFLQETTRRSKAAKKAAQRRKREQKRKA